MNKIYKLICLLIFTLNFQSVLLAVQNDSISGFKLPGLGNWSKIINSTSSSQTFATEIPLQIYADTAKVDGKLMYQTCISVVSELTFKNTSPTAINNTNYQINWGDGTANFSASAWTTIQHTYNVGLWILKYSYLDQDGFLFAKEYIINVRSKPSVQMGTEGLSDNCSGTPVFFPISGTEGNSVDTKYTITFNDDNKPIDYNPSDPSNFSGGKPGIWHQFLKSSCGTKSSTYDNSFSAKIVAKNACGVSEVGVLPIYVSTPPVVGFSVKPVNANYPSIFAVKTPVTLTNATTGYVNENGNCLVVPKLVWKISPSTGFALQTSETLGNDNGYNNSVFWDEGTNKVTPTFTVPGTYVVNLRVDTKKCGNGVVADTICIEDQLIPQFKLTNEGCAPFAVDVNNTTDLSKTCTIAYKWEVTYAVDNCGTQSNWSYLNNTNSASRQPSFNFITPGKYTLKLTVTNSIGSVSTQQIIIVKQAPTFVINSIPDACGSASIHPTAVVNACAPSSSVLSYQWSFPGSTPADLSLLTQKDPGQINYATPGNYTAYLTVTNECGSKSDSSNKFIVNRIPTVQVVANQLKCNGDLTDEIIFTGTDATVYEWKNDNTNIGLGASGIDKIASFISRNNVDSAVVATITVTPKNTKTGCIGSPTTFTITVNPSAKLIQPTNQVVTNGDNTASVKFTSSNIGGITSYQWKSVKSSAGIDSIGSGDFNSFKAINNSNTPLIYTITVTPTFKSSISCAGDSKTFTITVNPTAQVNKLDTIEMCNGTKTPTLVFTTNNINGKTTYKWTNSNPAIGLDSIKGSGNIPSFTLTNTTIGHLYSNIRVTPTYTNDGVSNVGKYMEFTIAVDPGPAITSQPVSSSLCQGGVATPLKVISSGGVGERTYQWYSNTIRSTAKSKAIVGETTDTYIAPTNEIGTIFYFCTVSLPTGLCNSISSEIASVSINEAPVINAESQPQKLQNLCVGGTISIPLKVKYIGGSGIPYYQWYSNVSNSNSGGKLIVGAKDSIFTPPVFNSVGHYFYYVTVTLSGHTCGSTISDVAEIYVVNDPTVKNQPLATQSICQNTASANLMVTPAGGVDTTRYQYQWYSNKSNSNINGHLILGANDSIYTPPTDSVKTTFYYCLVHQDRLSCNVTSLTTEVIVNANPKFIKQPNDTTVCINEVIPPLAVNFTGGVGKANYQWFVSAENSYTSGTAIPNAITNSYQPSTSTVGTVYYYCQITGFTGGCSSLTSKIVSIKVNPKAVIAAQNLSICSGNNFKFTAGTADLIPEGTTFAWSAPIITPANSISGASASLSPTSQISETLTNKTNDLATANYTVTPISGSCTGMTFNIIVEVIPTINPTVTLKNSTCPSANNGSISCNIIGGKPFNNETPYIVLWTGPNGFESTKKDISNLSPGDYSLKISDNGGCPLIKNFSITEPKEITITNDIKTDIKCHGDSIGQLSITVNGGTPPYTYEWTKDGLHFATSEDISNLKAGIYALTVLDANKCAQKSESFQIVEPQALEILMQQKNVACFGDATGEITVTVVGGNPSDGEIKYGYTWSGPNNFKSSEQNLSGLVAGTYQLEVKDKNECTKSILVTIAQPNQLKISLESSPITCFGSNNATITATITGGNGAYKIEWNDFVNGVTFRDNLSAGNYTITVTDANGCQATAALNIAQADFAIAPAIHQVSCFGDSTGSINLNITGGLKPIKVVWEDNPTAGSIRNNLKAGTYTVSLQDGAPCIITKSFVVKQPVQIQISSKVSNAFDCENENSGAISLAVTGGKKPYGFEWSNGNDTKEIANLKAGNYSVIVTDSAGCVKTAQFEILRQKPIVLSATPKVEFNCDANSFKNTYTANISGGFAPYQFSWSKGIVSGANNEFMEISKSDSVVLTATDSLGCTASYTFIPFSINSSVKNVSCNGEPNGSINLNVIGNNSQVKWAWKDAPAAGLVRNNLKAGTYILTLNNGGTCVITKSYVVLEPSPIEIAANVINAYDCNQPNSGAISLTVKGGNSPYSYVWSNDSISKDLVNIASGKYSVTVTDAAGCNQTAQFEILRQKPLAVTVSSKFEFNCGANSYRNIYCANISGGIAPYAYSWSKGIVSGSNNEFMESNKTETVILTVTDSLGCSASCTFTTSSIHPAIKNVSCFGANDGSINLNLTGSISPITWSWKDSPTAGAIRNNLKAGTYILSLKNGVCEITKSYVVLEPTAIVIVEKIKNAFDCNNINSGSIHLEVSGGKEPYTYIWSNGSTTKDIDQLLAGSYSVTVTDSNQCVKTAQYIVTRQKPLVLYVSTTTEYNCEAKKYLSTNVAHVSGGFSPYQYTWSSGTVSGEYNEIMKNDKNNVVVLSVTDALGCSTDYTFTINNPFDLPTVKIDYRLVDCRSRSYLFDVTGSDLAGKNNTYTWDFGDGATSTTKTIIHNYKTAGNYKVRLTMSNGICPSYFEQVVVIEPLPELKLDRSPMLCVGETSVFYVSGANQYLWSDGTMGDSILLTKEGKYSVIGTSVAGCKDTLYFTASFHELLKYSIQTEGNKVDIETQMHFWTKDIPYSRYSWNFGDGTELQEGYDLTHKFSPSPEGYYDVTLKVINPNGCSEYDKKRIWVNTPTQPAIITPNGDGVNDLFMKDTQIKLYNRNGILIYEGNQGWDGTFKNKMVSEGTYFYVVSFTTEAGVRTKNGYVTVVR
ncbi:MAG: PKD domain-containing protein [Paludibacter sp.]